MDPTEDDMDTETQITVSKRLFIAGFFLLPWLWIVNYFLFRPYQEKENCPDEVKRYLSFPIEIAHLIGIHPGQYVYSLVHFP